MAKIKVGVFGVGNACSSFIQGLQLCKEHGEKIEGLVHWNLGGYTPLDIEIVAAFDIDKRKVGKDLSEAIFSPPNNMLKLCDVPKLDVTVEKGHLLDEFSPDIKELIKFDDSPPVDIVDSLKSKGAEILVNLVPSSAIETTKFYAEKAIEAGCGFINCVPVFIASDAEWVGKFEKAGLPVVGDDLESQAGSTILHRWILEFLTLRSVKILETYALDVGGSPESIHALDWEKTMAKRIVKTEAVKSAVPYDVPVVAGSTDYVDFLGDFRDTLIWIKGTIFGGAPITIDLKIKVPDGANAVSPLMDAIRGVKIAMDRGISGALESVSAYAFKHPPKSASPKTAEKWMMEFIEGKREK